MSNRSILILSGSIFLAIPLLFFVGLQIWFGSQYAQLETFEDTQLISQNWRWGDTRNSCHFDILKEKTLSTVAHPNEIWSRSPNAYQQGKNAHLITEPPGVFDEVYLGFLHRNERVFLDFKEAKKESTVYVKNAIRVKVPQNICEIYRN